MSKILRSFLFIQLSIQWVAYAEKLAYTEDDWKAFIKPYLDGESVKQETLCKTAKGRDVEVLRAGKGRRFRILVTARHSVDAIGNYVMEGFIEAMLSEEYRNWFLPHKKIVSVPFVEKDGVEDNAPGTDYSKRYGENAIPAADSIKALLMKWEKFQPSAIIDLHTLNARNAAKGA